MYWFLYYLLYLPIKLLLPVKVVDKKNFNREQNYIVCGNHRSGFDAVIIGFNLRKKIRFIAKKELWRGKKKSFLFDSILGAIPVDRENGLNINSTKKVFKALNNNENLGIFPEGTRANVQDDAEFEIKDGVCLFAIKSKKPILPCYIAKKQKPFKRNVLIVGEPFELAEYYNQKPTKEVLAEAGEILKGKILDLRENYLKQLKSKKVKKAKQ